MKIINYLWQDEKHRLFFIELVLGILILIELFFQAVLGWQLFKANSTESLLAVAGSKVTSSCTIGRLVEGWLSYATYQDWLGLIGHVINGRMTMIIVLAIIYLHPQTKFGFWGQGRHFLQLTIAFELLMLAGGLGYGAKALTAADSAVAASSIHAAAIIVTVGSILLFIVTLIRLVWRACQVYVITTKTEE